MISLRELDTSKVHALMGVGLAALAGISYIQFKPKEYIPYDSKIEPFVRAAGYALVAMAGYEAYRTFLMFKHGETE